MINTHNLQSPNPTPRSDKPGSNPNPQDPQDPKDTVELSDGRPPVPTAVKLYDMSPYWWPAQTPIRYPSGVRGLC